ncbi:MAG: hypothetical protein HKM24_04020 [Gammaproteobacteria bacterium]|nr:hypothetical protein [Gammaproteobacteria bacterium]
MDISNFVLLLAIIFAAGQVGGAYLCSQKRALHDSQSSIGEWAQGLSTVAGGILWLFTWLFADLYFKIDSNLALLVFLVWAAGQIVSYKTGLLYKRHRHYILDHADDIVLRALKSMKGGRGQPQDVWNALRSYQRKVLDTMDVEEALQVLSDQRYVELEDPDYTPSSYHNSWWRVSSTPG